MQGDAGYQDTLECVAAVAKVSSCPHSGRKL